MANSGHVSPSLRDSQTGGALTFQVKQLESDIKVKNRRIKELLEETKVAEKLMLAKDEIIEKAERQKEDAEERALSLEVQVKSLKKSCQKLEKEKERLTGELDKANEEADALNQALQQEGRSAKGRGGSLEDVANLQNKLYESRSEMKQLKDENKSLRNVIAAKDGAIEEGVKQVEEAKEANARKREDQNIILDLRRRLKRMEEELGGEHRFATMTEQEAEDLKGRLASKEMELEEALEIIERGREEVEEARILKHESVQKIAEATKNSALAMEKASILREAERERMKNGGYVSKQVFEGETKMLNLKIESLEAQIAAYKTQNSCNLSLMTRAIGSVDKEISETLSLKENAEKIGDGVFIIQELRNEVKGLTSILAEKESCISALNSASDAILSRLHDENLETIRIKMKLAAAIGEEQYSLEIHEPCPRPEEVAQLEEKVLLEQERVKSDVMQMKKENIELQEKLRRAEETVQELGDQLDELAASGGASTKLQSQLQAEVRQKEDTIKSLRDEISFLNSSKRPEVTSQAVDETQMLPVPVGASPQVLIEEGTTAVPADMTAHAANVDNLKTKESYIQDDVDGLNAHLRTEISPRPQNPTSNANDENGSEVIGDMDDEYNAQEEVPPPAILSPNEEQHSNDAFEIGQASQDPGHGALPPSPPMTPKTINDETPQRSPEVSPVKGPKPVNPANLSAILDRLIVSKHDNNASDSALYDEAIQMLQAELSRLSVQMANDSDMAMSLKSEVGDLRTAHLSAQTTAELLESYNALSMKVSAQQVALHQKEIEYTRLEDNLLQQISDLKYELKHMRSKPGALKSVKKAMSSTIKGIQKTLDGNHHVKSNNSMNKNELASVSPLQDLAKKW